MRAHDDDIEISDLLEAMAKGNVEQCYKLVKADDSTQIIITPELVNEVARIAADAGATSITSVGCGTGLFEWFLAKKMGHPVTGIEPCERGASRCHLILTCCAWDVGERDEHKGRYGNDVVFCYSGVFFDGSNNSLPTIVSLTLNHTYACVMPNTCHSNYSGPEHRSAFRLGH